MNWPTQHDLPTATRERCVVLLNLQLADALDLALQAKQAHWNVKGPHFGSLHALFDEVAETLGEQADDLAERCVQLGGVARGTVGAIAAATRLSAYPENILAGADHVRALAAALGEFARTTRAGIDTATEVGDADTADLFTQVSRAVDKLRWQVEVHALPLP